ncbi:MAG: hypothetical protein KF723_23135 [Rhizobiaceae bacterium]|nr:hypothetical protein [Rhizobiaceae bacterium]
MPKKSAIPHVAWRDGRPRFSPSQLLRGQGHKGRDLRHADGRWFSRGEAVDWSDAFRKQLADERRSARSAATPTGGRASSRAPAQGQPRSSGAARERYYTIAQMCEDWQRSPRWRPGEPKSLAASTMADYRIKLSILERDHPLVWSAPAHLVARPTLRAMFEELWAARGLASARGVVAVLSACFSWAILRGKARRQDNPALKLAMELPDPRVRFGTRPEISALVAAADAVGRPEIGDMVMLAVWTGQRQADRLQLLATQKVNGRRHFRQGKTGAIVAIREAPELEARLARAAARRAAVRAAALLAAPTQEARREAEIRFGHVVLDEAPETRYARQEGRWVPFDRFHYADVYAQVREAAARGVYDDGEIGPAIGIEPVAGENRRWLVAPCPSVADLRDQDLRDTSVTWMALAGVTIPEIISVTGHTPESATRILKHYLAQHPAMADSAIGKMIAWYDGNGETEFGL